MSSITKTGRGLNQGVQLGNEGDIEADEQRHFSDIQQLSSLQWRRSLRDGQPPARMPMPRQALPTGAARTLRGK